MRGSGAFLHFCPAQLQVGCVNNLFALYLGFFLLYASCFHGYFALFVFKFLLQFRVFLLQGVDFFLQGIASHQLFFVFLQYTGHFIGQGCFAYGGSQQRHSQIWRQYARLHTGHHLLQQPAHHLHGFAKGLHFGPLVWCYGAVRLNVYLARAQTV